MARALALAGSLVALVPAGRWLLDRYPSLAVPLGVAAGALRYPGRAARKLLRGPWTAPVPGGIAELATLELNGAAHRLLVRGRGPLLLLLHGGPGASELPFCAEYQRSWESHFLIAQYDQRGAGGSAGRNLQRRGFRQTLTIDQHVDDCLCIAEYLLARFPSEDGKLFLVGGSWGSALAMLAALRRPDLFRGPVVLRGLVVDTPESEALGFAFLRHSGCVPPERLAELAPPAPGPAELVRSREWLARAGGMDFARLECARQGQPVSRWRLKFDVAFRCVAAREVGIWDMAATLPGLLASLGGMWAPLQCFRPPSPFPLPVIVAQGREDRCTAAELVEPFLRRWSAPAKRVCWFEKSGHSPHKEEPVAFGLLLRHAFLGEALALPYPLQTVA